MGRVDWDSVFNMTLLEEYHEVITMKQLLGEQAEQIWPVGKRISFCYSARNGKKTNSCNAKDGSPFGPFLNHLGINFDNSEMFAPLNFQTDPSNLSRWKDMFPSSTHQVLAITGAPASFPVQSGHVSLKRHLHTCSGVTAGGREGRSG